jgi:mRNA degradation ribonuclease J1/J2
MTKENLKEYIELLEHQISIATTNEQIKQFKNLIEKAKENNKLTVYIGENDYKIFNITN